MLFNFPPTLHESNWLQDFLIDLVKEVLSARLSAETARTWGDILPLAHADALRSRSGLKSRYQALARAAQGLSVAQAQRILAQVNSANYYMDVLSGAASYRPEFGITDDFEKALKALFDFGFDLLGVLEGMPIDGRSIRDSLYYRLCQR